MPVDSNQFLSLFQTLSQIDLFGAAGSTPPIGSPPNTQKTLMAIKKGRSSFPAVFDDAYIQPLIAGLEKVFTRTNDDPMTIETLAGAVYQHADQEAKSPLNRFLAVISDLYRSFLSKQKRAAAEFPVRETLPPLAMFQHDGSSGPFTIPCDDVQNLLGGKVGVVSLPATYAAHPFLWASLAHETGGHDVTHADETLLPELIEGVQAFFGGGPISDFSSISQAQLMGLLWGYWMDEASADVYGTLNAGPEFGLNLIAFFAALNARASGDASKPQLRSASGFDPSDPNRDLDVHPTDLLRPYLVMGVVDSLQGLSQSVRQQYIADLNTLAMQCANGATAVQLVGFIHSSQGVRIPLQQSFPLDQMQVAARQVGAFIASAKLDALGAHSIQDIETWDDMDEATAQRIAVSLTAGNPISGMGDDAQLLAGATLAALGNAAQYEQINSALNDALDSSFANDPIWGTPQPDPAFLRNMRFDLGKRAPSMELPKRKSAAQS